MKRTSLLVALAATACATGFDAKRQVETLGSHVAPEAAAAPEPVRRPQKPDVERATLNAELFAYVPIATDVDPFPARPAIELPADAKPYYTASSHTHFSGGKTVKFDTHTAGVQAPWPIEQLEREAGAKLAGIAAIPDGTACVFQWIPDSSGVPIVDSRIVRMPPLATARDVAGAKATVHQAADISNGKQSGWKQAPAVLVTFTAEATTRMARWAAGGREPTPMLTMVRGRVHGQSELGAVPTSVYLDFDWLPYQQRARAAEALASELRAAAARTGAGK